MKFQFKKNMMSLISLFGVTLILSLVFVEAANQEVDGPCSRFQVGNQQPFYKKLFMGTWYVYATYDYTDIAELDCLKAFYQLTSDGNARNTETGKNLATNGRQTFQNNYNFVRPGVGHYTLADGTGVESIEIPIIDYMHYYIEFSCVDLPEGKADCYVGVYTRLPFPSAFTLNKINGYLNAHNIDRTNLRIINHDITRCIL